MSYMTQNFPYTISKNGRKYKCIFTNVQITIMIGRGELQEENKGFKGIKYVRGWGSVKGVLGSIGRFLLPIASNLMESAKGEAINTLGRVSDDLTQGRPVLNSIRSQTTQGLQNVGQKLQQCGKGKKRKKITPKKLKQANILNDLSTLEINHNQKSEPINKKKKSRKLDYLDIPY